MQVCAKGLERAASRRAGGAFCFELCCYCSLVVEGVASCVRADCFVTYSIISYGLDSDFPMQRVPEQVIVVNYEDKLTTMEAPDEQDDATATYGPQD